MNDQTLHNWHDAIEAALDGQVLRRVRVLTETGSTQDAAFAAATEPGLVVVAGRQTCGRGRLGRAWQSDDSGVAMSCVISVPHDARQAWRLPIAAGLAAASACDEALGRRRCRVRWPNDVIEPDAHRKLAGALVEVRSNLACIGIGINVLEREWPQDLQGLAVSLEALGSTSSRLDVMCSLARHLPRCLQTPDHDLIKYWREREMLIGRRATFAQGTRRVSGIVREIDPTGAIVIALDDGQIEVLNAAVATLIEWD